MATISAADVKQLRTQTGAGMMDCKRALTDADGDLERATELLRERGLSKAGKRAGRETSEGTIGIALSGATAAMLELGCETDFVAKTDDFIGLAKNLAMHIAAANPLSVSPDDIDDEVVAREKAIFLEQIKDEGKPEHIAEKIVEGKLRKFFEANSLLMQPYVKDPQMTISELITQVSSKTGEKIEVARFSRLQVGQGS